MLKNNRSRVVTGRNCEFPRHDDIRKRSRMVLPFRVVRRLFLSTVRLGARVPRAAVVTADFKDNHKNNRRPVWISYSLSQSTRHEAWCNIDVWIMGWMLSLLAFKNYANQYLYSNYTLWVFYVDLADDHHSRWDRATESIHRLYPIRLLSAIYLPKSVNISESFPVIICMEE